MSIEQGLAEVHDSRPGSLLVVCTANVCRSPLGQIEFGRAFAGTAFADAVIGSAGTRALDGESMCAVSALQVASDDAGHVRGHRARQLTADLVRSADLVLTMEREQRSAAVRAAPGSQAKVFTLREVESLLGVLVAQGRKGVSDLPSLARALHSVRGLAPLVQGEPVKKHWWSRPIEPEDPMTIPDGHGLSVREHEAAVETVRATADRVGAAIVTLISTRTAS